MPVVFDFGAFDVMIYVSLVRDVIIWLVFSSNQVQGYKTHFMGLYYENYKSLHCSECDSESRVSLLA